jgi:hypothetical protein
MMTFYGFCGETMKHFQISVLKGNIVINFCASSIQYEVSNSNCCSIKRSAEEKNDNMTLLNVHGTRITEFERKRAELAAREWRRSHGAQRN